MARTVVSGGKRSRQTYSKYQTAVLETVFRTSKYIVRSKRQQMSAELNLTERQIKIWFQNRRMKEKKCHRDAPRVVEERSVPAVTALATGYGDDYAVDPAGYLAAAPTNNNLQDDAFADYRGPEPSSCKLQDDGCYAGYPTGGYDLLTPEPADTYVKQQWQAPVTAVDFHQDLYGDVSAYNINVLLRRTRTNRSMYRFVFLEEDTALCIMHYLF
jgi:hypothetical protein